jgi:hypothetical protein
MKQMNEYGDEEISLNFDDVNSRQGPQKPQDGFEIEDESDINGSDGFDGDDLLENLMEYNYEIMSQLKREQEPRPQRNDSSNSAHWHNRLRGNSD